MRFERSLGTFRVIWQRVGESERFQHVVEAESLEQAREKSSVEVSSAIGPNIDVWEIVDVAVVLRSNTAEPAPHLK